MIFITLGSQKFQFNRVLIEIDRLIQEEIITEKVFAQVGYSDYKPKNYKYKNFLDRDEFSEKMDKCKILITHGGTGAIIGGLKKNKKVIAIARLAKYDEHVDDHQLQIVNQFNEEGLIIGITNVDEIKKKLELIERISFKRYKSNTQEIIKSIEKFILS